MLQFKSASAFPPCLHSAQSLSRRNMDTTFFQATAHFPPRAPPKSFSIDWILSSGHRKPSFDTHIAYTQPKVIMRGGLFPASTTNRPFVGAFGSACVHAPQFYYEQNAAFRNIDTRLYDGHQSVGEFGMKTCRRIRTVFSAEQQQKLEEVFAKQRYMTGSEKVLLASALRLTETQVKVWFQNRRTKWRKNREVEQRLKDDCSDLKHETSLTEDGEFKSVDSDEFTET
ncbi:Homeobox protein not2 [Bagarius yarrelli]|uniref:Homeobox protein not2 n=1 Tax=Bagarius yarrelli TaxID=175774 RepID=A0A556TNN2_BAGYA|nr:Homeobox protein not2 [Bagarius yarrelli]